MIRTGTPGYSAGCLFFFIGSIAASIGLGRLHDTHNADSLLPVLVSLQHWTPFYWGQNRFGMLVPLLAIPFHHPLFNLLVQGWITTVAALLAPFLAARHLGAGRDWFAAGSIVNALMLLVLSREFRFDWLVTQPFALSISLALMGLLLIERAGLTRTAVGTALMLLAHWVNVAVFIFVLPCVLLRTRFAVRPLFVTGIGMAGGFVLSGHYGVQQTITGTVPFSEWPHGWVMLLQTTAGRIAHPRWFAAIVVLTAVGAAFLWIYIQLREPIRAAVTALVIACVYWFAVGTFRHVQFNEYFPRYVLPSLLLVGVAIAVVLVASVSYSRPRLIATIASIAFVTGSFVSYGVPSLQRLRRAIDRTLGVMTPYVLGSPYVRESGATVIVGDYWTVWPAVFHANLVLYEQKSRIRVFGLTYRSDVTDPLWATRSIGSDAKRVVLAAPRFDTSIDAFIARVGVRVTFVEYRGPAAIFVTHTGSD